jgi:hypothetical protein
VYSGKSRVAAVLREICSCITDLNCRTVGFSRFLVSSSAVLTQCERGWENAVVVEALWEGCSDAGKSVGLGVVALVCKRGASRPMPASFSVCLL